MQDLDFWILNDVIWVKTNPMPNWLGVRFTNATETLIWAVKDKSVKNYTFNKEYAKSFGIGKIGANVWMVLTSTKEGDLILDPLAGTGTTGYAAKMLGRDFVLIEKNPQYVQLIRERLFPFLDR